MSVSKTTDVNWLKPGMQVSTRNARYINSTEDASSLYVPLVELTFGGSPFFVVVEFMDLVVAFTRMLE